jgi:hypothetical protein
MKPQGDRDHVLLDKSEVFVPGTEPPRQKQRKAYEHPFKLEALVVIFVIAEVARKLPHFHQNVRKQLRRRCGKGADFERDFRAINFVPSCPNHTAEKEFAVDAARCVSER